MTFLTRISSTAAPQSLAAYSLSATVLEDWQHANRRVEGGYACVCGGQGLDFGRVVFEAMAPAAEIEC